MRTRAARNAFVFLLPAAMLCFAACAAFGPRMVSVPCDERYEALFPLAGDSAGLELIGRVRLELPRYRLRGLCRILASRDGMLRIDFRHSSLFGAVSDDVTIIVGERFAIFDREEGKLVEGDSSLALLRRAAGTEIEPDDLLYVLLLAIPRCADMRTAAAAESDRRWSVEALWRGRSIEIEGNRGEGPRRFRQCFDRGARCFAASYDRYESQAGLRYPRRIRLAREGGSERITLELTGIKSVMISSGMFDVLGSADTGLR